MIQETLLEYLKTMRDLLEHGDIDKAKEALDSTIKGMTRNDANVLEDEK